jgi:putative ABC transport system permease protein
MKKEIAPPPLATRLLNSFLRSDLAEEVRGDLEEKFYSDVKNKTVFKAKLNYWYQVLNYLRPFALRKSKASHLNQYDMFQSYFKIGWRNLLRNKGYSFINIGGLAIGITVTILIGLWVHDELMFDRHHENYDRLAQVMHHQTFNNVKDTRQSIPRPLEFALRSTYGNDFKYLSMASWTGDHLLSFGEKSISKSGNYFQVDFPEMLSLEMMKGTRQGLKDPTSILLSASTAKALFGSVEPLNQPIRIGNKLDVKVTGVYKDLPYPSSFSGLDFMASWELYANSQDWIKNSKENWGNHSFQLYAQISPHADMKLVSEKIKKEMRNSSKDQTSNSEIFLHPMADWHLRSAWKEGEQIGGRIQTVWLFGIIGVFVLILACVNFMNLSTARSEKRAKEVGIRMTIGSVRTQLINQFLSESFLVVVVAFVVAIGLVVLCLPWFNDMADKKISVEWGNPLFWLISFVFILFTSLLAGSYPALYLSSFHPVKVLKGTFKVGRFASLPRKVLVVVQFTVSLTLIIGTIIVYQQIQYSKSRPVGYNREGLVMIQMKSPDFIGKLETLRSELKSSGAITEMSESSGPITNVWSNNAGFGWPGKDPNLQARFATVAITHDYGKTVNWKIVAGRDLSREFSTDSAAIILNETALKFMGLKDPVGTEIKWHDEKLHVVGVIKDMIMESPYAPVRQTIYYMNFRNSNWINIKLSPDKSISESLTTVESIFRKHIPSAPFDYKFVDEEFGDKFQAEERVGKLASVFAVFAILISCLGLFGLASYVAEQRTKEIGIRKVLGASIGQLWQLLSKDFVALVIISCVIAIPLSFYYMRSWLLEYEYRTTITWDIFALASVGALAITLLTVSFQAIKAAVANPVNSLKSE